MTKRTLFTLFTLGWLGAVPLWAQQIPELVAEQGYADLVLINGKIVSMDNRSTTPDTPGQIYQSMAVKGKRIMALGSNQEMRSLAGPDTHFLDVGSRTVLPGLIQTHHHTFLFADLRYGPEMGLLDPSIRLTVETEATPEATAKKVRDTIGTLEPGKFADFAILDRDFFTIPVAEIPDIEVVLTGLGGKIIYDEMD